MTTGIPTTVLAAPDSFKGTFSAAEVGDAIARGMASIGRECEVCPIADGGEGTQDALLAALGGETVTVTAHDPLGREIEASFALLKGGTTAVVEVAQASGHHRVAPEERDAEAATTAGTGELVIAARDAGAREILIAAGGSATTDGGAGAIEAIEEHGGLGETKLVVLCDVRTPFEQAAEVFGPQKGADPAAVKRLTARLRRMADELPKDPRGVPLTGAAGGLAGGLWAALGAKLEPGAPYVLAQLGFDARMRAARAVIVGEGRLDPQTMQGKAAGEVATRCRQAGVPCHAIVGSRDLDNFGARLLDLQTVTEAPTLEAIEAAARELDPVL